MPALRCKPIAALAAASIALAAAGCGSSAPSGGDPASVVPASAPLYVAAIVRPGGSLKTSVNSISQALLHVSDPGPRIQALLAPALRRLGLDYRRDIKSWIGSRIGVFATSLRGAHGPDGAIIAAATDTGRARAALVRVTGRSTQPVSLRHYRGVMYMYGSNTAAGIVGSYAVIGSETALRSVVDVRAGGASLAASSTYTGALARLSTGSSIATLYARPHDLPASTKPPTGAAAVVQRLLGVLNSDTIVAAVPLDAHRIAIRASGNGTRPSTAGGASADTLAALPGDSWLALGAGDIGAVGTKALEMLGPLVGGLPKGLDLRRDLFSWAGNVGIFVRGTGLADIGAAIAIQSKNRAASRAAVPRIAALLEGLLGKGSTSRRLSLPGTDAGVVVRPAQIPVAIDVVDGGGKLVIGLGDASVAQALHPTGRFADSADYRTAAAALGGGVRPVFVFDSGRAVSLLDELGLSSNRSVARILPYLRALSMLAVGVGHSGTQTLVHAALTLR